MTELCVDASVAVKLAMKSEPFRSKAFALFQEADRKSIRLIAPLHFMSEVDSTVSRRLFYGRMTFVEAKKAYTILEALPIDIVDADQVRERARQIAQLFNQELVYDSTYAALAEVRGCQFWTADKRFFDAVRRRLTFVRYLPYYAGLDVK